MTQFNHFSVTSTESLGGFAWAKRGLLCLIAMLAFAMAAPLSLAQETTATVRGTVLEPSGAPAAGVSVTVTDTRTGARRRATTNANGVFSAGGLSVGGPYTVKADSDTYADATVSEIYLNLGETYTFTISLGLNITEEIITTAARIKTAEVAVGPSATFDVLDLEGAPAVNRDIKDLIKIDPRIYIDEGDNRGDTVQCAGANPRFNSLTVDGVRLNDNFGLNRNGYPTVRLPFSYDAIQQVAVELAPFDVQYGGFTACNINAVFKSGANDFSGSAFYDYTSDSLTGDSLEGNPVSLGSFSEKRYGVSLGGPIIKDKLFFFLAYEKLEGVDTFARGPAGSGRAVEVEGVSEAQANRIAEIAERVYGYDPGGLPTSIPVEDEKILAKFDWNINDQHRASFTYNWNDGFAISESDGDNNELEFSNHYYERGNELTAYVAQMFSDWTENFSTEIRVSNQELDNRQIPLGGTDFGEVQIRTFNDPDGDGNFSRATVYLGADDSRHANDLAYESWTYKLEGTYSLGNHSITGGFEQDDLEIFNMFIQEAEGEYRFDSLCGSSNPDGCIDAFESGDPSRITYENAAPSNVKTDAAAMFSYKINTLYLQDEYNFPDEALSFIFGVRYDWYDSNDLPAANQRFFNRNGFTNAKNFDGESLLQPRFGFTWDATENLSLRGGIGLYSGGNPNVWLSNNYSNNGITQVEVQERGLDDDGIGGDTLFTIPFNGGGRPIFDIPQELFDAVASGTTNSGVNAIDPNFKIPSQWKYALGATFNFDMGPLGEDYTLNADYLYTRARNSATVIDAARVVVGTAPDGRPIYRSIDGEDPDCVNPTSSACSDRFFNDDFILSNVRGTDGNQTAFSVALTKAYDFGLDWTFAYSFTEAEDVNPMTSSVAFSNFVAPAVSDYNNPGLATSNYEIPHRFTLRLNYGKAFVGDYETKFTVFGSANKGRPFSYTFADQEMFFLGRFFNLDDDRQLLYMPTGASDPKVRFDPGFDQDAFFAFAANAGLTPFRGQIVPRNAFYSDWWTKFDVRISQELPGFSEDHRASAFLVIENIGNLLNDDWGVLKEADFPRQQAVVEASIDSATNQYVFQEFFEPGGQSIKQDASLWEVRVGLRYSF